MMRVFVSYTSKDQNLTDEKLHLLEERIKPFAKAFIDRLHNKRQRQSRVFFELRRCDVVLCLASTQHMSQWVQKELVIAKKKGKPVLKIGVDELLALDDEQLYTLLTDIEKKPWSVWAFLGVSLLACLLVSILGLWASYSFVSARLVQDTEADIVNARGLFGDSWGGVNAIISAFAFAGVIVTLFLQNRDLNLQRKEMARQREEFEKENETLKYQRFENLFYNMLNLQQKIVDGLRDEYDAESFSSVPLPSGGQGYENRKEHREVIGREVFRFVFDDKAFILRATAVRNRKAKGMRNVLFQEGLRAYDEYWAPTFFDHYFRHLYKILQFVDSQAIPFEEAYKYISFLRGTLSRHELVWIYYNGLQPQNNKLKLLVEKYALLKNIRPELLSLTAENAAYIRGLGITEQELREHHFSARDFEFYLTDNNEEKLKYHISAFWKKDEIWKGESELARWRAYISQKAESVIEQVK